jgi:DNA primase large subunit
MEIHQLAKYPFLKESQDYIKNEGPTFTELINNIAFQSAWAMGKQRLMEAIDKGEILDHGFSSEVESLIELLSYITARILVSCVNDDYLVKRYALAEAVRTYKRLQDEKVQFVMEVAVELDFKLKNYNLDSITFDLNNNGGLIKVHFTDYLQYAAQMRSPDWKLINRDLEEGYVPVNSRELARMIQEYLRRKNELELPVAVDQELKIRFKNDIQELREIINERKRLFEAKDFGKISVVKLPPCIKQLLGMTQNGENVPHVGRFALASFLHTLGLNTEDILKTFATSPDFDVNKARYQVEHITGKISGTEYTPPGCDYMKSNGVCFNPDRLCKQNWMNHPLKYYRVKDKGKGDKDSIKNDKEEEVKEIRK